ncbi:MAG TPA: PspA/IM30 family protein, partial [Gammaproteobacteria bacterium]
MALITRVSRLFRADAHAVLDRLEEPALLLRQAVREMEAALADDERRRQRLDRQHTQLVSRRAELGRTLGELARDLDVCFEAGKQELARTLLRRRLESERLLQLLERRASALAESLAELDARLDENRARCEAMRQKAELLAGEERADDDPLPGRDDLAALRVRDDEV